jgi:uncharacterized membrane protein YhaH (DUF805 family)
MNASEFFGAMFDPLKRFADFSGRSTRGQFWPFVFFWYAVQQIIGWIAMSPFMERINKISEAAALGEEEAAAAMQNFDFSIFTEMLTRIAWLSGGVMALLLLPMAAAITRRLHDTNRSGFWALPTLLLLIAGLFVAWRLMAPYIGANAAPLSVDILSGLMPTLIINLLYIITIIMLIVFCVKDGTIGPNHYGEDPKGRIEVEDVEVKSIARGVAVISDAPPASPKPSASPPTRGPARIVYDTPPSED